MGNFLAFLATTLQQSCQNFFVHVQTKILRKNRFFGKFILFFIISGVRAKSFQSFDEKLLAGFSQLHSTCTLELQQFWSARKFFVFFGTKLWQAFQNFLVHVSRMFWGETTLLGMRPKFSTFPEFEHKVFRVLTRNFLTGSSQLDSAYPDEDFLFFWRQELKEKLLFSKKNALPSFWDFAINRFSVFLAALLWQACQNFVVHVQTKIFTNNFFGMLTNFSSFPEIQQKFFRVLTTKFRQGGHNCIIHVHRNIFRKVIFLSKSSMFFPWFTESELPICGL